MGAGAPPGPHRCRSHVGARYNPGDVLLYSRGSRETGFSKGEYTRVKSVDAANNRLTIELRDGSERTYDPRRQQGVSVYREQERDFSVGDRVQLTAPSAELRLASRELGTAHGITEGRMALLMDGGRSVEIDPARHPHIDHGYAVTSHSSQEQTADRVLVHIDTELGAKDCSTTEWLMSPSPAVPTMLRCLPTIAKD